MPMPRPTYSEELMLLRPSAQPCQPRRPSEGLPEPIDVSLLSTILLILVMLVGAAFFIMTLAYLLSDEYDVVMYPPSDGVHALVWAVKQSTRGCAGTC